MYISAQKFNNKTGKWEERYFGSVRSYAQGRQWLEAHCRSHQSYGITYYEIEMDGEMWEVGIARGQFFNEKEQKRKEIADLERQRARLLAQLIQTEQRLAELRD